MRIIAVDYTRKEGLVLFGAAVMDSKYVGRLKRFRFKHLRTFGGKKRKSYLRNLPRKIEKAKRKQIKSNVASSSAADHPAPLCGGSRRRHPERLTCMNIKHLSVKYLIIYLAN